MDKLTVGYVAQLTTAPYVPVLERGPQDTAHSEMMRLLEVTRAQAAELAALRKDAERYRWLCDTLGQTQLPTLIERITNGYVADYKPSIDSAIDAAMAGTPAVG